MLSNKIDLLRNGVNVIGYFQCRLGLGESARLLVSALEKKSIPFSLISADFLVGHHIREPYAHAFDEKGIYATNILCLDVFSLPSLIHKLGIDHLKNHYNIILFFWETNVVPQDRLRFLKYFDEVWVTTRYNFETISPILNTTVSHIPHPLKTDLQLKEPCKASFGLQDKYTFLFCFDFFSIFQRKNPTAIIEAFRKAFPKREDVQLVIKTQNGHYHTDLLNPVLQDIESDPRLIWIDESMDHQRRFDLMNSCDCYISLHRSEGFGLTMAEAMLMEKPVIATGYSGNLDFMTRENSFLCDYKLVPIGPENKHYSANGIWANVNIEEAAFWMDFVVNKPGEARTKALRGKKDLLQNHSSEAIGTRIADRLEKILPQRTSIAMRLMHLKLHVYYLSVLFHEYCMVRYIHYRGAVTRRLKKLKNFFNNTFRGQRD